MEFYLQSDAGSEITLSTPAAVEFVLDATLSGPKGDQGIQGIQGPTGPATTDASLLTTGTLPAGRLPAHTGDVTSTAGSAVLNIATGVIINSDINAAANIDATKLGTGIVNNTEFNYLDGLTSAIQTQLNAKAPLASPTFTGTPVFPIAKFTPTGSPTYAANTLVADSTTDSLTYYNSDANIALQIGQEEWVRVINNTGVSIPNGSPVYVSGSSSGIPTIALAKADAGATVVSIGLTTETIANGATGFVTSAGLVNGLDTSAFSVGAVYVSAVTAGALTQTPPLAPNYRYRVGFVTNVSATIGRIHVTPSTAAIGNGTADQLFGMNSAGTAQELKTIVAGANVTVTPGAGTITIASTGGGGGSVSDATTLAKGIVQLAGDLGGTAALPTVAFGNDTLHVLRAGDTITGTLNLTAAASISILQGTNNSITIAGTVTSSTASLRAFTTSPTFNGTGAGPAALENAPIFAPPTATTLVVGYGVISRAVGSPATGAAITNLYGQFSRIDTLNGGGTIANTHAFYISAPSFNAALKPTANYGLNIQNQGSTGVTNSFGLNITAQSGSTNNYVINTGAGIHQFGGTLQPLTTNTLDLGTSSAYWANTWATRHNFNSTSYIDGGTTNQLSFVFGTATINELRMNGTGNVSIFVPTDNQISISNNGDSASSLGASLQLKPSTQNYLFSFEGRGGFRYYSRVTSGQTFAVNDAGSITQVVGITASGQINTVSVVPTTNGSGTVGDFTHYYSGAYLTSVNFNSSSGIQANGTNLLGTGADFWGSRGFKFGPNAGTGTDPLSGIIAGVSAYVNAPVFVLRGFTGQTADLQRWQNNGATTLAAIDSAGQLNLLGTSGLATHTLTLGSTATGIALYNSSDQTTNYERLRIYQASNLFNISSENGGTGVARNISLNTPGGSSLIVANTGSTAGYVQILPAKSMGVGGLVGVNVGVGVNGANSLISTIFQIAPTINASGTNGYTALLINPTETATGSGVKLLADFQTGGSSKTNISNTGILTTQTVMTNTVTKTTAYSAVATDDTIFGDATTAGFTVTLPAATGNAGAEFTVKKIDSSVNVVTVATSAGNIDAAATYTLSTQHKYVRVRSNGTQYYIVGNN